MIFTHQFYIILTVFLLSFSSYGQSVEKQGSVVNLCQKAKAKQQSESEDLVKVNKELKAFQREKASLDNYYKVREIWINLTRHVYQVGAFDEDSVRKSFGVEADSAEVEKCIAKLLTVEKNLQIMSLKTFVLASSLRTREIAAQSKNKETPIFKWTDDYFKDHLLEIKVIPLRWVGIFTSKFDRFQSDIKSGVEGWIKVAKDILLLLVFIFSLVGFIWFSLNFNRLVSPYREKLLKQLYSNKKTARLGYWFLKIFPYIPWALLMVFVRVEQGLIQNTYFSDLSIFFPYIAYYGGYKIFRIFISQVLINFLSYARGYELKLLKEKVERSANILSNFVIWSLVLLHTADSAVGKGFIYIWIDRIFVFGLVYIFISQSKKWENEIEDMIKGAVPEKLYSPVIKFSNRLYFLRSIFLLGLSILFYLMMLLYNWFQTLEIAKTLSARVFRERVKNASGKAQEGVPEKKTKDYEKLFYSESLVMSVKSQEDVVSSIEDYVDKKKSEDLTRKNIGVIGASGIGMTQIFSTLESRLQDKILVKSFSVKSRGEVDNFLESIKSEVSSSSEEAVFIVDDLHFLFLSKVGGFDKIKQFFTFIDRSPDRISWVVGINKNSWNYLDAILNKTRYFSSFYNLEKWTEAEIKELILSKHQKTQYGLSFNNILLAMKSENYYEDKKYVEEKYFRILWEESLGNPDVAQKMWVESLNPSTREKNLNVGIPHSRFEMIKGLPNDFYFVLASIVRHADIRLDDLAIVNDVDNDFVRNAVEFCEDQGYIVKNGFSAKIAPLWQNNVTTTLAGKNYIYGK